MLSGGVLERGRLVSVARLSWTSHHRLGRGLSDQTPVTAPDERTLNSHATLRLGIASHTMYNVRYSALEIP